MCVHRTQVLFQSGDPGDKLFFVIEGRVEIYAGGVLVDDKNRVLSRDDKGAAPRLLGGFSSVDECARSRPHT